MPFAATWIDLEIIILSKTEKDMPYDITCTWNLKYNTRTSLVGQWLRLHAPRAGSLGLIPGQGTRSHMLQIRVHMQ